MGKRVAAIEFAHESNTFSILTTDMDNFHAGHYLVGDEIPDALRGTNSGLGGFIEVAEQHGWTPVYTVAATATPGGPVTESTRKLITDEILLRLRDTGQLDGIFIALHGAMVTETSQDGETQLLKLVRDVVGDDIPIAVTLDLHANVFDELADHADIAVSYRTYPHVDMADIGQEACELLSRAMTGEIDPALVIARPPMLAGCDDGRTTNNGPMCKLLASAKRAAQQDGILGISINAGFTDADVFAAGPSVIVCFDKPRTQAGVAKTTADRIVDQIWDWRDVYDMPIPLAECLTHLDAPQQGRGPIIIADFSDNPGAGAYGDCTAIIGSLLDRGVENAAAGALWDPVAAAELTRLGVGAEVCISIGGKTDPDVGGGPITVTGEVAAVSDGAFIYEGPMIAGLVGQMGASACLTVDGLDILVVSKRIQLFDQNIFRAMGVEPAEKSILVVKSMQHFRAAFAPIAGTIIVTDAGGLCSPDVIRRTYRNIRRPVFPLL